jgi:hypothetical protein
MDLLTGAVIADVRFGGVGRHQAYLLEVKPEALGHFQKLILPIAIIYLLSVVFPRLAVLSTYRSIFTHQKVIQITSHIATTLILANCIGSMIAGFLVCIPLEALWDTSIDGHCINFNAWFRWTRLVNILSDVVILILPLPYLLRLQGSVKVKVGLITTFLLGSL